MHRLPVSGLRLAVVLLCLAIGLGSEGMHRAGWLKGLENAYGDLAFRLSGVRAPVTRVALVELDDASLATHPDDPLVFWTPHFAQATQVLRSVGAQVVALDFLFSISPEQWFAKVAGGGSRVARVFDQRFRQELASGKVVLAGTQAAADPLLPAADYLAVLPEFDIARYVGAADLPMDGDGTLRRLALQPPGAARVQGEGLRLLPLSLLLAIHASGQAVDAGAWQFGNRTLRAGDPPPRLAWAGPPGTVPRLPMKALLAPGAAQDPAVQALRGKVVIIGVAYGGSNDVHMTPYGQGLFQNIQWMRGPEIQAQAVEALLAGRFVDDLPPAGRALLLALTVLGGAWVWWRLALGRGALVLAGVLLASAGVAYAAHRAGWVLPLAQWQLTALATFLALYGLRFSSGERERARVRKLFSRYVSPAVVSKLLASGEMPQLGGQAMEVTVLFSDIRNFTTLSERLQPEEVVEMLNRWFEGACAVIQKEGGSVDKFIGDAIMAEFGAPLQSDDHPRQALRAAQGLQQVAVALQTWMAERFAGRDLPPFAIGVGVHTGSAVVGNIGWSERMEYTAIGDTVNLAARLEGVTKDLSCGVAASRATVAQAGSGIEEGAVHTLQVKGRAEPVEVVAVLGVKE